MPVTSRTSSRICSSACATAPRASSSPPTSPTSPNCRAFATQPDDDVTRERIEEFNQAIAEQALEHDVLMVDTYGEPVEDDLVSDEDGFHPNNRGHQRIADRFLEVILPALGLAPRPDQVDVTTPLQVASKSHGTRPSVAR